MFDTVVIATDGSETAARAVSVALDFAAAFDASVHALYVVELRDLEGSPDAVRAELAAALEEAAEDALSAVRDHADRSVETAVREGDPRAEIIRYADDVDADVVAVGTRGRHGEHAFLLGSVAEGLVRRCDRPVLTVRQLADDESDGFAA
ncbi:MAG: universal stress protein [Haloarculaceae archaeon]